MPHSQVKSLIVSGHEEPDSDYKLLAKSGLYLPGCLLLRLLCIPLCLSVCLPLCLSTCLIACLLSACPSVDPLVSKSCVKFIREHVHHVYGVLHDITIIVITNTKSFFTRCKQICVCAMFMPFYVSLQPNMS